MYITICRIIYIYIYIYVYMRRVCVSGRRYAYRHPCMHIYIYICIKAGRSADVFGSKGRTGRGRSAGVGAGGLLMGWGGGC